MHVDVLPPSITVGAHMIHAVGISWAEKLQGTDRIAITYFGDGATSEGDFHEAMNFAGVFKTPTVFLCQNNGYAISMPRERQTASDTIAQKADAYGMVGEQVDGNDLFAVYASTKEAVDRARAGEGATLIEAVTYRVGPHTTNDDPGRYRDPEEERLALDRDPIERVRRVSRARRCLGRRMGRDGPSQGLDDDRAGGRVGRILITAITRGYLRGGIRRDVARPQTSI